jgi:protein translocase SEC61 complex gamma subunit
MIADALRKAREELASFHERSLRVLRVSYRPTEREFWSTAKITALGMLLIGMVGFLITLIFSFI